MTTNEPLEPTKDKETRLQRRIRQQQERLDENEAKALRTKRKRASHEPEYETEEERRIRRYRVIDFGK